MCNFKVIEIITPWLPYLDLFYGLVMPKYQNQLLQ